MALALVEHGERIAAEELVVGPLAGVPGIRQRTRRPSVPRVGRSGSRCAARQSASGAPRRCGDARCGRSRRGASVEIGGRGDTERGIVGPTWCGCCSTRPRRTGSTGCSRSSTTAGSTRCSGRRPCARARWRAGLDERGLRTLDVGAGTGFTTEGIVDHVDPERVTMLDQSPHQLARARAKPALAALREGARRRRGLPFADRRLRSLRVGRQHRVLARPAARDRRGLPRPARRAASRRHRPVRPGRRLARRLADAWMLFPTEDAVRRVVRAGRLRRRRAAAPWRRTGTATARAVRRRRRRAQARRRRVAAGAPAAGRGPARRRSAACARVAALRRRLARGRARSCRSRLALTLRAQTAGAAG